MDVCLASVMQFFVYRYAWMTLWRFVHFLVIMLGENRHGFRASEKFSLKLQLICTARTYTHTHTKHTNSYLDRWSIVLTAKFSLISVSNSPFLCLHKLSLHNLRMLRHFGNLCRFWCYGKRQQPGISNSGSLVVQLNVSFINFNVENDAVRSTIIIVTDATLGSFYAQSDRFARDKRAKASWMTHIYLYDSESFPCKQ